MQDKKLVEDLKIALREIEEGKTRPLNELVQELNLEGSLKLDLNLLLTSKSVFQIRLDLQITQIELV
jgi:hypothetical protein